MTDQACKIYAASRPRKGDPVTFEGKLAGHVSSVNGNLCYLDNDPDKLFIWCFRDGLNKLHDWPTKRWVEQLIRNIHNDIAELQ